MSDQSYGDESIKVLEGLEAVRKRPGMYIGDPATTGLYQCIWEVVDNGIDEALAGYCDHVDVIIHEDNSVSISDNGRGIPVGMHSTGKPTVEVVMTVLHAGGKFDDNSYKVSGGLHGVGVSCVNAVSVWTEVEVMREGRKHLIRFERGETAKPLEDLGACDGRGTTVRFKPDWEIFGENTVFDYKIVAQRLRELSFLNKGVRINFQDQRGEGRGEVFYHADGLAGFVRYLNKGRDILHKQVIHIEREAPEMDGVVVELALQYNDSYDERIHAFANNIRNRDGGTHLEGFKSALTRVFNSYARNNNMLKKGNKTPSGEDLREGLTAIVSVKLPDPKFSGQTKDKLINSEITGVVNHLLGNALADYLEENPKVAKTLISKALLAQQARDAARKARELARKERKGLMGGAGMPDKLRDCQTHDVGESEIFLVEGDSAGGSAKRGSDQRYQAILPLKGKIINVEKARIDKVLGHSEISAMIQALGIGIGEEFNLEGLRYGKVIIMTDADVDGSHIRTLLLTFFYRQMLPLIERGHVYVAQPPLFKIKHGKREEYVFNESALAAEVAKRGREGVRLIDRHLGGERTVEDASLGALVDCLDGFEDHERGLALKGLTLQEYLSLRNADDQLPMYRLAVGDHELDVYSDEELQATLERLRPAPDPETEGDAADADAGDAGFEIFEFAEREAVERSLDQLRVLGYDPAYLFDIDADRVAPFVVVQPKGEEITLTCLSALPDEVREIGRKSFTDIQRYKGLGEMNPDQLWETTMDPTRRSLVRVTVSDGVEAERMFATLMGTDVAIRRDFIERNALAVAKKLDV